MSKVFLCYSSEDKFLVNFVAKKLGRARVLFDEMSFQPGQDFRNEIRKNLDSSTHFIFFASENSISSLWCKFEWKQAELNSIMGKLINSLCIIIDSSVTFNELPLWLTKIKAIYQTRSAQIVRDIQHLVLSSLSPLIQKPFIGRETILEDFSKTLSDFQQPCKKVFIISGLEGIGRKTYLEKACREYLGINLGPFFTFDNARDLIDIYLWALDETKDIVERIDFSKEIEQFNQLTIERKIDETINRLSQLANIRCIPCIIDTGGILDEDGEYKSDFKAIINNFTKTDEDKYISFIHRRTPKFENLEYSEKVLYQKVNQLEDHSTITLLTQLLRSYNLPYDKQKLNSIVNFLGGYPPCVYFAVNFIRDYGIDVLVNNKEYLVDFKAKRFTEFLKKLSLTDEEWLLIRYLASEESVPFSALSLAVNIDETSLSSILKKLIDNCLIVPIDESYYMAKPIKDAVYRVKIFLDKEFYQELSKKLEANYWTGESASPTLEIVDATLHAIARSGSLNLRPFQDLVRPSILQRLSSEFYHKKDFENALEYAKRTIAVDNKKKEAYEIQFKALVQLEQYDLAEQVLYEIEKRQFYKYYYLKGFMLRKQCKYSDAIKAFENALASGDRHYSVYRDYADCLYRVDRLEDAIEQIKVVLKRDTENKFVLDLVIRIFLDLNKIDEASKWLTFLEKVDYEERFIHHRKATFYARSDRLKDALNEAELACKTNYSPFEAFAQKIDILIDIGNYDEARKGLTEIENRFSTHRKDIRLGLQCKLFIKEENWREAFSVWNIITNKEIRVVKQLYRRIHELKSVDRSISLSERQKSIEEIEKLKKEFGDIDKSFLIIPDEDIV